MTYYSNTKTRVIASGPSDKMRAWAGRATDETIVAWMVENSVAKCFVSVDAMHKGRGVNVTRFTLNQDGARA